MSGAHVRYRRDYEAFEVEGHGFFELLRSELGIGGPAAIMGPASLSGLVAAVRRHYEGASILISPIAPEMFDDKYSPMGPLSIEWRDGRYRGVMEMELSTSGSHDAPNNERQLSERFRRELDPWLRRRGCRYVGLEYVDESGGFAGIGLWVRIIFDLPRNKTVAQLLEMADDLSSIVELIEQGGLNFERALGLIQDGRTEPFIGYPENEWLEGKAYPYPLDTDAGKIELAQDVARFANGENAALLIVGFRTKRRAGIDVIDKLVPAPSVQLSAQRYRAVLNARIYPSLLGLNIHTVPVAVGQSLLVVVIPEQPEHLKPFLVHGAIVGNKVEGAFISVIKRSGEASIPTTAPEIHALLVAGRRHLRGEIRS